MGTTTPNYSWYKPAEHEGATGPSYHVPFNANWDDLDTRFKALLDGRNADAAAIAVLQTFTVNARAYLKGDGTTEDAGAITDFAAACVGKLGYIPAGSYTFPDGVGLPTSADTQYLGAGRGATNITVKNAYAFQAPATGAQDRVTVKDLTVYLRSGSTSGGGVKAVSNSYHAGWNIENVQVEGVSTSVNPLFWLDGYIGSFITRCGANNGGGRGIFVDSAGFISNAFGIYLCSVAACGTGTGGSTTGAITAKGGLARIRDNVSEANRGYGLDLTDHASPIVDGNWFEGNANHNILAQGVVTGQFVHNKFQYTDGTVPTARHIMLSGGVLDLRHFNRIEGNIFIDPPTSGVSIDIGTNMEDTLLIGNRGANFDGGSILDNGTRTVAFQTDNPTGTAGELKLPGGALPFLRIKGTTQTGGNAEVDQTGLFSVTDSLNEEKVGVTRTGHLTQRTPNGDPGGGLLPTKGFTLFWDESDGKVKARVRNNSGAEFIHTLSN